MIIVKSLMAMSSIGELRRRSSRVTLASSAAVGPVNFGRMSPVRRWAALCGP
jgi:hypothetical protein